MENKLVQTFSNEEFGAIRTVLIDDEVWFVAADVCRALGIQNPGQAIENFSSDEKGVSTVYTLGGPQQMNIVNEPGLYRLIFQSRKPNAVKFQYWVCHEVLPSIRKTGGYQVSAAPPSTRIVSSVENVVSLKKAIEALGVKQGIAAAQAISIVEKSDSIDLSDIRKVLPAATHEVGRYNATQISQVTDFKNARDVNLRLLELGLQYRDGKSWMLTEAGKQYGEVFPYTNNGHSGYQILWSPEVLEVLENYDDEENEE